MTATLDGMGTFVLDRERHDADRVRGWSLALDSEGKLGVSTHTTTLDHPDPCCCCCIPPQSQQHNSQKFASFICSTRVKSRLVEECTQLTSLASTPRPSQLDPPRSRCACLPTSSISPAPHP